MRGLSNFEFRIADFELDSSQGCLLNPKFAIRNRQLDLDGFGEAEREADEDAVRGQIVNIDIRVSIEEIVPGGEGKTSP